jgi:hypothetical protein
MLLTLPPAIHQKRLASNDFLATTIESLLLKISIIRAVAYKSLYGHESPQAPDAYMFQALDNVHEQLKRDEAKLEDQANVLDRQLEEYRDLLQLVDGGGFSQIVDDWTRVQKETEECKRDLMRLGWTGD